MASTPTTRNRLLKQGTGDNTNTWGDQQSSGDFDMIDVALDGVLQLAVSGNVTLSTANYVDDQARRRGIKFTSGSSASATITLPALEKWYLIWNASTFDQIVASSGGGASVTVKAGEMIAVMCDATNVARMNLLTHTGAATFSAGATFAGRLSGVTDPASAQDAATRNYVDTSISAAVWSVGSFGVPITAGNAGQVLTNNGSTPSWTSALTADLSISTAVAATGRGFGLQTSGAKRFYLGIDSTAEGGSNAGSNFFLGRYNDAGTFIDNPIAINRATGLVTFGAAGIAFSSARTLTDVAVTADILTGTTTAKASTIGQEYNALAEVTLTDAATITVDMSTFLNAKVTLGGNRAMGNPSNPKVGQTGFIRLIQDATGSRTLSFGSNWKRQGGAPTLTTTANAVDVLEYQVITSTYILYNVLLNPS